MPSEFDTAIAVTPEGEGRFGATIDGGWRVGGGINGGYALSVIGNALRAAVPDRPDPLAVSAFYLGPTTPGPATVRTRMLRDGSGSATLAADLMQPNGDSEAARITVLATYGDLATLAGEVATTALEPELPPREQCVSNEFAPAEIRAIAPLMGRFDMLFDPACVGWALGEPSGRGMLQAWFRLNDGREPDSLSLLTAVDALPPVTFDLGRLGWAPTMELSVHVRARPAPGWLKIRHETRNLAGGMFEEDCEVWDSAGRLVAQSRQLAKVPR